MGLPSLSSFSLFLLSLPSLSSFSLFLHSLGGYWEATGRLLGGYSLGQPILASLSFFSLFLLSLGGYWEATLSGNRFWDLSSSSLSSFSLWEATGRLLSRATDRGVARRTYLSLKKKHIGPL